MIPFAKNMRNKPNTFIPVKQIDIWIDSYINSSAYEAYTFSFAYTFSISRKSDGLRRICIRFTSHFIATVWLWFRSNEEEEKKQKTWKKGVSQSPLESSKLAGDNGIVNWGKSFPKASVRIVLEASGHIESDGRSLKNGLKPSRIKWRRRIFSNPGYEFFH